MILYAGEILGMEDYNVTRYKVFKTYLKITRLNPVTS